MNPGNTEKKDNDIIPVRAMKIIIFSLLLVSGITVSGQDSTTNQKKPGVNISGYADIYYQYDFNKPAAKLRPPFLYNFKMHDEVNTNLILLKASYDGKKIRANLGAMAGRPGI